MVDKLRYGQTATLGLWGTFRALQHAEQCGYSVNGRFLGRDSACKWPASRLQGRAGVALVPEPEPVSAGRCN